MVNTTKNIAIIGGSLWGNRGAAAMLETTIHKIRESVSDANLFVFTPYPEKDQALAIDPDLTFYDSRPFAVVRYFLIAVWSWTRGLFGIDTKLSGAAAALTGSDLLLDIGGITFADGRLIFLPYNVLTIWPSLLHNVPVVKLSQAAGSFRNPILRVAAKYFLPRCEHFFARGEKTMGYLKGLGLDDKHLTLAADIAFCYRQEYCLTRENVQAVNQLTRFLDHKIGIGQKVICFSPSVLVSEKMKSTQNSYADLVLAAIRNGDYQKETYLFVPNATREGSKKTRNNDLQVIKELRDQAELELPSRIYKKIIWIDYDLSTRGVDELIKRANIVVASRFHTMVAALRSFKPTLIIGWGHKYKEVMERFGQGEFVFSYNVNKDIMLQRLTLLKEREETSVSKLMNAFEIEHNAAEIQFDYLEGLLF